MRAEHAGYHVQEGTPDPAVSAIANAILLWFGIYLVHFSLYASKMIMRPGRVIESIGWQRSLCKADGAKRISMPYRD